MVNELHPSIQVEYQSLKKLRPNPKNTRTHPPRQVGQIASSVGEFGFLVPVVVDENNVVLAGHGRIEAAKRAGLTEVPTVCVTHLSEAQKIAFAIADNKLTQNGTWNESLLAEQLKILSEADLTFELEITGFETAEIDLILKKPDSSETGRDDPADDLSGCAASIAVSRLGDLWLLDNHRVLCGSAINDSAYAALMEMSNAAMICSDAPYNVPITGHASGQDVAREFAMASGEMRLQNLLRSCARFSRWRCVTASRAPLSMFAWTGGTSANC